MIAAAILSALACAATAVAGPGILQSVNEWNLLRYDVPFNYPNADLYKPEVAVATGLEIGKRYSEPTSCRRRPGVGRVPFDRAGSSPRRGSTGTALPTNNKRRKLP